MTSAKSGFSTNAYVPTEPSRRWISSRRKRIQLSS